MTPEDLASLLKQDIAKDDWVSHVKTEEGAILQLATLILKHNPRYTGKEYETMYRFYMFGYLTGQLQQKWKDQGLLLSQEEIDSGDFDEPWDKKEVKQ